MVFGVVYLTNVYFQQRAYGVDPDSNDERVCLAQWNNCGYTISSLGMCGVSVSF